MTGTNPAIDPATDSAVDSVAAWSLRLVAERPHGSLPVPAEDPVTGRRAPLSIDWRPGGSG